MICSTCAAQDTSIDSVQLNEKLSHQWMKILNVITSVTSKVTLDQY